MFVSRSRHPDGQGKVVAFSGGIHPFDGDHHRLVNAHIVWQQMPNNGYPIPCRMLTREIDHAFCSGAYERSRQGSPFNTRLYARFYRPGELVIVLGGARFTKRAEGAAKQELSAQQTCEALIELGVKPEIVRRWVECGALESAMAPPSGPIPPVELRKPPSQR